MAPVPPLGRMNAMRFVREGRLPFRFGAPHPCAMCLEEDGMFRIRQLVSDPAAERAAFEKAMAEGRSFQPENVSALAKPTGTIYAEAKTREGLLAIMETMEWPNHW